MNASRLGIALASIVAVVAFATPAEAKPITKTVPGSLEFPHGSPYCSYADVVVRFPDTRNTLKAVVHVTKSGQPFSQVETNSFNEHDRVDSIYLEQLNGPPDCPAAQQRQMATWTDPATVDVTYDPDPTPTCNGKDATIVAKPGRKTIGTQRRDVIYGTPGNDRIDGRGGNDLICSGNGRDVLVGGPGNDELHGFPGRDILVGGPGKDYLAGGYGSDRIVGGEGRDDVGGGFGNDVIDGGAGNDDLLGGPDRDRISGGAGNDRVKGGEQDDRLFGGSGRDVLLGDEGNDVLFGGAGRDKLVGGTGRNTLQQ